MYFSRIRLKNNICQFSNLIYLIRRNGYAGHQLLWELFPKEQKRSYIFREEIAKEQLGHQPESKGEPLYYLVSNEKPLEETPLFIAESRNYSPKLKAGDNLAFKLRANPVVARKETGKKNSSRHDIVMDAQRNFLITLGNVLDLQWDGKKSEMRHKILTAWKKTGNNQVEMKLRSILRENERFSSIFEHEKTPDKLFYLAMKAYADKALEKWLTEKGKRKGFQLLKDENSSLVSFQAEGYRWHPLIKKGRNAGFSSVDFEGVLKVCEPEKFIESLFKGTGPAKGFGCGLMLVRRV